MRTRVASPSTRNVSARAATDAGASSARRSARPEAPDAPLTGPSQKHEHMSRCSYVKYSATEPGSGLVRQPVDFHPDKLDRLGRAGPRGPRPSHARRRSHAHNDTPSRTALRHFSDRGSGAGALAGATSATKHAGAAGAARRARTGQSDEAAPEASVRSHGDLAARRPFEHVEVRARDVQDRKSTRLNSSHLVISYAVFCLKKKHTIAHHPLVQ